MPTPRKPCRVCGSTEREPGVERYCSRKCHLAFYTEPDANGCLVWRGPRKREGYGVITMRDVSYNVHRVAWEIGRGAIPPGMCVCHTCDNRACCNVEHMFLGSNADNSADAVAKRRTCYGDRAPWSKLTKDQARQVIADKATPHAEYARRFGVSPEAIAAIRKRKNWKYAEED